MIGVAVTTPQTKTRTRKGVRDVKTCIFLCGSQRFAHCLNMRCGKQMRLVTLGSPLYDVLLMGRDNDLMLYGLLDEHILA